ncbi:uncharacterized protein [Pseudorasbora parva]|uniref:uncharacterized protein n=1 Tax=Pseudorasbora parva TaxID=51549 RepID=UPI00351EDB64
MRPKDFEVQILCFIFILLNCPMKGYGSSLKCCFEILRNYSVSYQLSEPPGAFCTPTWSEMEFVVVDEYGNVDETKVIYLEPQKLILKGNMDEKVKQVTYRKDCPHTGHAYIAECHGPCDALNVPRTTPASVTTQVTGHGSMYIIVGIIIFIIILIITIISTIIRHQRNKCQTSRCIWKAVPKNETALVTVAISTGTIKENTK